MPADENTLKRLEYFAQIGDFLFLISDDKAQEDAFYEAKQALTNFTNEINKLELPAKTKNGVDHFIKYIDTKINKRMNQANQPY